MRQRDGVELVTPTETTQPSADAVLYWATGLTATYFDGAFARASRSVDEVTPVAPTPAPLRDVSADRATYIARLGELERLILDAFRRAASTQLATQAVFDQLPHAHADVVRALEDLEKQQRLLVRRTESGNDWVVLTEEGAIAAGL